MRNNFFHTQGSALWQTEWSSTGMEPAVVTFQTFVEEHHQLEQTFELTVLSMRAPRL